MMYKGYEITKGEFVYKWFVWDKDDNYVSMHWNVEDAMDAVDRFVDRDSVANHDA